MTEIDVTVARGTLLFRCGDFEAVFARAGAVVLLRETTDLWILPLHQAAIGGHLVKLRNAAGDRAIDALEFFRSHELEGDLQCRATWVPERGALLVAGLFA